MNVPLIAVDIGNSAIRVGQFSPCGSSEFPRPQWAETLAGRVRNFDLLLPHLPREAAAWYVASVNRPGSEQLQQWLADRRPQDRLRRLQHQDLPLSVCLAAPERVGMDRLAAAVAANRLRDPQRTAIVVDLGTAITVDAVAADGSFQGGAILPGMRLAAKALADQTDLLPLITASPEQDVPALGKSTEEAIRSGLVWGAVGAIRELAGRMADGDELSAQIFITGGDGEHVARRIAVETTFYRDLVLSGVALAAMHLGHFADQSGQ